MRIITEEFREKMSMIAKTKWKDDRYRKFMVDMMKNSWKSRSKLPENIGNWKGGKTNHNGYVRIFNKEHPENHLGYVFEHRVVIEKCIGKFLPKESRVHHIDENKSNNSLSNLIAFTSESAHQRFHNNSNNVKIEEILFDGRKYYQDVNLSVRAN